MKERGIKISPSSALKCAVAGGIHKFKQQRQCHLPPNFKKRRLFFAKKHKSREWKNALFVDEAEIELNAKPNSQNNGVWAEERSQIEVLPKDKHPLRVNVFAGVSWSGRTNLIFYSANLNGHNYSEVLKQVISEMTKSVFKKRKWMVVQDGVPPAFHAGG